MKSDHNIWIQAQSVPLEVASDIEPGFVIGFDQKVPESIRAELRSFVRWMESHYRIPVTFWVDFEYRHYLKKQDGTRAGYLFYWSDFDSYPVFDKKEDIPQLRLAVRADHWTIEEILMSFIEAILCYYAWICNRIDDSYEPDEEVAEEILQEYLRSEEHLRHN